MYKRRILLIFIGILILNLFVKISVMHTVKTFAFGYGNANFLDGIM